jgi:excisionase family DNA binding protein
MNYNTNYKHSHLGYNNNSQRGIPSGMLFKNRIKNEIADENETWWNTHEASDFLSISPNALRILVHRAKVRAYKLGTRLRFRKSDLILSLQLKED